MGSSFGAGLARAPPSVPCPTPKFLSCHRRRHRRRCESPPLRRFRRPAPRRLDRRFRDSKRTILLVLRKLRKKVSGFATISSMSPLPPPKHKKFVHSKLAHTSLDSAFLSFFVRSSSSFSNFICSSAAYFVVSLACVGLRSRRSRLKSCSSCVRVCVCVERARCNIETDRKSVV